MINFIKNWYRELSKPMDIKYLEQASDLVDLEHRQQQLMRRQAPFQTRFNNINLRGNL
jgi:hypothetical protein